MSQERRRFYRIDDQAGIKCEPIDPAQVTERLESFWNDHHQFSIRNDFNFKIEQHQADLNKIKASMPELGRYLDMLQEQIDLLTDKLLETEDDFTDDERQVNLSAQGLSFYQDQVLDKDSIVELHLKLLPSRQQIVSFARVIQCEMLDHEQGKYRISLDFENIHEADQEILVKHVHAKQLRDFGASRFDDSPDAE
ncbi:MAG: PilZ domain-containing protein [Gammaproteobacteria bacterium]|nr:PilZ domain-containing protein [Gammaproteobacteria bacterium]